MGDLAINVTGDDRSYLDALKRSRKATDEFLGNVETNGRRIEDVFSSIGKKMGVVFGAYQLKNFASEIIKVRGEMQMLESSFEVLLGGKGVSGFISQLKQFAVDSPLSMTGVSNAAQTLLGFNIEAEKVIPTIKQLGDISMGNEQRFNSLTLAFAQMSSTGKLMGQDLLQMINAGFNPLSVISEQTGKSIGELKKEMEAGAISSEMVAEAFRSATAEGGKFYGMTQKQAEGLKGLQAQLEGAIQDALDEMGKSQEGVIASGYKMATSLVENYETVGKVLATLVATYGTYRAAVVLNIEVEKGWTVAQLAHYNVLLLVEKAQKMLNATMMSNPYILAATALIALVGTVWALHDGTTAQEKAQARLNEVMEEAKQKKDILSDSTRSLVQIVNDETETLGKRIKAYEDLQKLHPSILSNINLEQFAVMSLTEQQKLLNKSLDEQNLSIDRQSIKDQEDLVASYKKRLDILSEIADKQSDVRLDTEHNIKMLKEKIAVEEDALKRNKLALESEEFARRQAEISLLSEKERTSVLTDQLKELENQESLIRKQIKAIDDVNNEWLKQTPTYEFLGTQLDSILHKIEQTKEGLSGGGSPTVQNKSYWEKQKKAAEEALNLMDKSQKGGTDWNKQLALLNEANSNLSAWDFSGKKRSGKDATKKAQETAEQLLKIQSQNKQDEINLMKEGLAKELAQIDHNYSQKKIAIKKQEDEWSKANKGRLKEEQSKAIKDAYDLAEKERVSATEKANKAIMDNNLKSQLEYLKEFGTFHQKKLAIAEEYAEKIKKAEQEGNKFEVDRLKKKQQSDIASIDAAVIKSDIDWTAVFGEFGSMFKDVIKETLDKAKAYTKTDDFKNSDAASQKAIIDGINQMEKSIGGSTGIVKRFKDLSSVVQDYQDKERILLDLKDKEIQAYRTLEKATKEYNDAIKEGTEVEQQAASERVNAAKRDAEQASNAVKNQSSIVVQSQNEVADTASSLNNSMQEVTNGLSKLASGGLKNIYDGFIQGAKGIGGAASKVADSLESVPIIGWILSIIDVLKDGLSNLVGSLLDAIFDAVGGILEDVLSGDLFKTIASSIASGIGRIFDALSFGGFSDFMTSITGSNAEEVAQTTNSLTSSNKILKQSIDALKDEMEKARGLKTVDVYDDTVKKQKEVIENSRKILAAQMGYYNSHHSNNYYVGKSLSDNDWDRISGKVGKSVRNMSDLWGLSPEELKKITTLPDVWDKIYNGGKYNKREYIDDYLELAGSLKELEDALNETLTQTTFDNIYDEFVSMLMDMDSSTEDFAKNISEYFMRAMLSNKIGEMYADDLENWYKDFANRMKDGVLSESDREELRNSYMQIVDGAIKERDELADVIGYEGSGDTRKAQEKGITSMSQESGDKLIGLWTVSVEHTRQILDRMGLVNVSIGEMQKSYQGLLDTCNSILNHTRNIDNSTAAMNTTMQGMNSSMSSLREDINSMKTNGIAIKK